MAGSREPDLDYFLSIPWCAKLVADPSVVVTPTESRVVKDSTEDAFFAETLKTDETIKACLSFYKQPSSPNGQIDEIHTLISLGYRINGYPNLAHGGLVATVLDEVMGILISLNKRKGTIESHGGHVTAYLNVTYKVPVATPQVVHVTATLREIKGRKHLIDATFKDSQGMLLTKAEALWVGLDVRGRL